MNCSDLLYKSESTQSTKVALKSVHQVSFVSIVFSQSRVPNWQDWLRLNILSVGMA